MENLEHYYNGYLPQISKSSSRGNNNNNNKEWGFLYTQSQKMIITLYVHWAKNINSIPKY